MIIQLLLCCLCCCYGCSLFVVFLSERQEDSVFFLVWLIFSVVEISARVFLLQTSKSFQTPDTIRELWSGALNLTSKIRQVTASGAYQWNGKPEDSQYCVICLMIVMGEHFTILVCFYFKNSIPRSLNSNLRVNSWQSDETVRRKAEAVQVNLPSLDTRIFINKKFNKVQLLADARQKSYE